MAMQLLLITRPNETCVCRNEMRMAFKPSIRSLGSIGSPKFFASSLFSNLFMQLMFVNYFFVACRRHSTKTVIISRRALL
jgi:hypothetical protein